MRPLLLDLFCGAGGAAVGYDRAGFTVVGVDVEPQPRYPFQIMQADALDVLEEVVEYRAAEESTCWDPLVAIHASPPCQAYSVTQRLHGLEHPRLIEPLRELLQRIGLPYVIENVVGAPLVDPVQLCGSSFGLLVRRHRLFELGGFWTFVPPCGHASEPRFLTHAKKTKAQLSPFVQVYGTGGGAGRSLELWSEAMGIDWMETKAEMAEAIPPAYTEFIGRALIDVIGAPLRASEASVGHLGRA